MGTPGQWWRERAAARQAKLPRCGRPASASPSELVKSRAWCKTRWRARPEMGVFLEISLDPSLLRAGDAPRLVSICPVDIFALEAGQLAVRPDEVDECTLCELCLDAAPAGAIAIRKHYKDQVLVSRGSR